MDYSKDGFTINSIDKKTGNVMVTFDCDGLPQTISGLPLDDPESLKLEISRYLANYKAGKQVATLSVDSDVSALINKPQVAIPADELPELEDDSNGA